MKTQADLAAVGLVGGTAFGAICSIPRIAPKTTFLVAAVIPCTASLYMKDHWDNLRLKPFVSK